MQQVVDALFVQARHTNVCFETVSAARGTSQYENNL